MPAARFILHGDLDFFLPGGCSQAGIMRDFQAGQTVKHLFESLGVPHVEVSRVSVNGQPAGFDQVAAEGDLVEVYPGMPIPPPAPEGARFILDTHLGRLAAFLRLLGFDSLYETHADDDQLAAVSDREARILLSRDRGLLKRKIVTHGYCPRSDNPRQQTREVVDRYHLADAARPFSRCLRCNTLLEAVSKESVWANLQPDTRAYYEVFRRCPACRQVYWRGSHYTRLLSFVETLIANA